MRTRIAVAALLALPAFAQRGVTTFQAEVRGSGDSGKCTIEVNVDGAAEITVNGSQGRMRTLQGQPARWVRFQCNAPFPTQMGDFRFRGIDGRGRQTLIQDPRNNRGNAVIQIEDPDGGSEGYTFDLEWSGGSGNFGNFPGNNSGNFPNNRRDYPNNGGNFPRNRENYPNNNDGSGVIADRREALRLCRDAVRDRAQRDYDLRNIRFDEVEVDDDGRGRRDVVYGSLQGRQGGGRGEGRGSARRDGNGRFDRDERYDFSCEVNPNNGRVRSVNLRPSR